MHTHLASAVARRRLSFCGALAFGARFFKHPVSSDAAYRLKVCLLQCRAGMEKQLGLKGPRRRLHHRLAKQLDATNLPKPRDADRTRTRRTMPAPGKAAGLSSAPASSRRRRRRDCCRSNPRRAQTRPHSTGHARPGTRFRRFLPPRRLEFGKINRFFGENRAMPLKRERVGDPVWARAVAVFNRLVRKEAGVFRL